MYQGGAIVLQSGRNSFSNLNLWVFSNKLSYRTHTRGMFDSWSCSLCCTSTEDIRFRVELVNNQDLSNAQQVSHIATPGPNTSLPRSPKANIDTKLDMLRTPHSLWSGSTCSMLSVLDLSCYSIFIYITNYDGNVLPEQDLLYISEGDSQLPRTVFELRKPNM